ncbi:alpha/beta fold hydrolase [Paenibacillus sp. JX-17]|uniref:Alpha/beta fold hydrolase n=2 Tax=Paenibacillus lacisoli TaxID=3064525 RepID=A0ABT9CH95_9BACL|nr:alpha/beta fold hydrolase [Paenibacillus sp. JX-17]MDO7908646.1 alpha/beta fold hydrolase [Paenibacillus sp. JX-17]
MKKKNWRLFLAGTFIAALLVLIISPPSKAQAAASHTPVVFVHGLGGSDSNFLYIQSYLRSQGWSSDEMFAIDLPSKQGDQRLNSAAIASLVDQVIQNTGSSKVNIVAHSMGGANSLYYILNRNGGDKVGKLITLGGANRLTTSTAPEGVQVISIYSTSDTIVSPYLSILNGAHNIRVTGVSHIGLIFNSGVNRLISETLAE